MADALLDEILSGKKASGSGDPLLDAVLSGKAQESGDPLLDSILHGKSGGGSGDPLLDQALGKKAPSEGPTSESLHVLQQQANEVGAPAPAQDSPGLFRRALDLLSRGNYAAAGAAEELFTQRGGGPVAALKRAGREIFSGIGGLKGDKEGFAQVMEQSGIGEHGHFSDLVPFLYNETGEGARFQRGGPLDPTGRGAAGLVGDVFLDPTTYLGLGIAGKSGKVGGKFLSKTGQKLYISETAKVATELAELAKGAAPVERGVLRDLAQRTAKERVQAAIDAGATNLLDKGGIKWMGVHLADNPLAAIANSGVATSIAAKLAPTIPGRLALASTAWTKKWLTDPLGHLFVKGYGVRGLDGALPIMNDALDKEAWLQGLMHEDIVASPFQPWLKMSDKQIEAEWRPVIDAYQSGGLAAVPEKFRPAMAYYAQKAQEMYVNEVKVGLLGSEQRLENYFAHYYDNPVDDLAQVIYAQSGGVTSVTGEVERMLRLGRNAEERAYPTLKAAVEGSTRHHALDARIPILKPIYNPMESLRRRWEHSITKRTNREMVQTLAEKFPQLPFDVAKVYDLAQPVRYGAVAAKEADAIREIIASGNVAGINKLSDVGKKEFFAQRFSLIGDRAESAKVLAEYDAYKDFFPKYLGDPGLFAADGSRFMEFNAGNFKAQLPESIGREVAGMSDGVIKSKAARTLLQGFDTINNIWKGSVTWLFPAFHVRNAYSNVAQSFVDIGMHSINPASYTETAQILFGKGPGVFKTAVGDYSYDEVRQILNRHGVNTSAAALAEFTGNADSKLLKPFAKARQAGTAIENESRAQLALNYLRRGMDPAEIGARVKKFQLDYANGLTSFERQYIKRLIPFYAFQRLNLGLQLENILKRPGMTLAQVKPFAGRADENAQMTSWDAGALKLRLNRDGKHVQMITGIDLPIRNLDLLFRGTLRETFANGIGMLTPFLKVPIEVGANKSFFTGNEFDRKNAPTAGVIIERMPTAMQKWLGYKKEYDKAGRAQYTFDAQRYYLLAESFVASRFLSTSDRQWRQYLSSADGGHLQSLLDITTGLRYQNMDMDEEMAKRAAERKRDLENALIRWGQRKKFERVYKPKER